MVWHGEDAQGCMSVQGRDSARECMRAQIRLEKVCKEVHDRDSVNGGIKGQ